MKTAYIYPFPIKSIDFSNTNEKNKYDEIIKMIDLVTQLKNSLSKIKIENRRTILQRQIDATDKKINELIYKLYGLTKEEISIVEESLK